MAKRILLHFLHRMNELSLETQVLHPLVQILCKLFEGGCGRVRLCAWDGDGGRREGQLNAGILAGF